MIRKRFSVDEILNEFNNKSNLSDLISQFVSLEPRGNSFVGKCPFHNEKTPSFNVNNDKGLFYCFGCKAGGNAINFLSKYKNYSFQESVKFLAEFAGIRISVENLEDKETNNRKYEILEVSKTFFQNCLEQNEFAIEYLKKRVGNGSTLKKFCVGYCPNDRILIDFLKNNGFSEQEIKTSDLLIINKENKFFGRFRNRIIFPIYNTAEKVVGFGGRSLTKDTKIKYINSQESDIFKKSNILYGLKQNIETIRRMKELILVEGYMDVISLHNYEIKTAVSTMGTTLSRTQILKIWNLCDMPYVCFDGDEAGQLSAKKIAIKLLEFLTPGKSIKFIVLPVNEDPDSFLKGNSPQDFEKLKHSHKDLSELIWEIILESLEENTPEYLALLNSKINSFASKISDKTVSAEYHRFLRNKKDQYIWNLNKQNNTSRVLNPKKADKFVNEKLLINFMLFDVKICSEYLEEISKLKFKNSVLENIKEEILYDFSQNKYNLDIHYKEKINSYSSELYEEIEDIGRTHLKNLRGEEKLKIFKDILNNLRLPFLENERDKLKSKILLIKDNSNQNQLLRRYEEILQEIKKIRNKPLE